MTFRSGLAKSAFFLSLGALSACVGAPDAWDESEEPAEALGVDTSALVQTSVLWDTFDSFNGSLWSKADWLAFSEANRTNRLRPENVTTSNSTMQLALTRADATRADGSEARTVNQFSYGLFQVRMKPLKKSGTISSFFTWRTANWDEIDIEFLGKDTTRVQYNHYSNGVGGHEFVDNLGFDAAAGFHLYAFEWSPSSIQYYVDGVLRHRTWTDVPDEAQQVMMNAWARSDAGWAGAFDTGGLPVASTYDYVKVSPSQVKNPGFRSNLDDWSFWKDGSASASATWSEQAAQVSISAGGSQDWHVQFFQGGKVLTSGRAYRVSFDAKASCARSLSVRLEDAQAPYATYGAPATFSLGTSWSAHTFTVQATQSDADARLMFAAGKSGCSVWLDSVSVVEL